jgi:hypothetical protein
MKHVLDLQVFDGDKRIANGRFEQNKIVMGRILSADFRIPDSRVSRIHALLERLDDGSVRITDLASSHGTTVNSERVIERVIGPADDIRLAGLKLQMTFQVVEDAPEAPAPRTAAPQAAAPKQAAPRAPAPQAATPAQTAAPSQAASQVKVNRDPTVIRSLKDSARARGVMEATSKPHEELEVTVYWGETILNVDHCRDRRKTIRIGEGLGNDYIVASNVLPAQFDFIRVNGSEAEIQMHPSMRGSARVGGKLVRFEQDASQSNTPANIRLAGDDIAKIQVGSVHFFLMFVGKPPETPRDVIFDQGRLYWALQIGVSILTLAFLWFSSFYKAPIEGKVKEFPEQIRRVIVQTYKKLPQNRPPVVGDKAQVGEKVEGAQQVGPKAQKAGGDEGEGARERGEEGKRGSPTSKQETGVEKRKMNLKPDTNPTKNPAPIAAPKIGNKVKAGPAPKLSDKAKPKPMGYHSPTPTNTPAETIMSALRGSGLAKGDSTGGGGKFSGNSVDEAFTGVGGLTGTGRGSGGSGLKGTGTGGGGTAVGVGGLGTKGFGAGAKGTGSGAIPGEGGQFAIATETLSVTVLGSLSKEEIERVVNAHRSEIRFCYERELGRNPGLSGKVNMKWTIGAGGRVEGVQVKDNTTGSRTLSDCIGGYLKDWQFPTPAEGSKADVEWPWIFKPQGT